jgi:hypothetical protein
MKYIAPRLSVSLLAIAVIGPGCNQTTTTKYDGGVMTEEATLTAAPTVYSFPNTPVTMDSAVAKFTFSNIGFGASGAVAVALDGASVGDFVLTGSTCGKPLGYQESCEASVIFRPQSSGSKSARLFASATPGGIASVTLSATSQSPATATINPTIGSFPAVPITPPTSSAPVMFQMLAFTVTNTGGTAAALSSEIDGTDANDFKNSDGCAGPLLQPNASCVITVLFAPAAAGMKSATLNVTGDGGIKLAVPLAGTAINQAMLALAPPMQEFGSVQFGMTNVQQFTVTNSGGQMSGKITTGIVGASSSGFSITNTTCGEALNAGDTCAILVTFAPTAANGPGAKQALLTVAAPMGGNFTATLSGTAVSVSTLGMLSLTSSGGADPFGAVSLGSMSTALFTVQNNGMVPTGKVTATLAGSGNEFTVTNNACPDSLAAGDACFLTVSFQPSVAGRRTATLQVIASPGGFATLPISGTGQAGAQLTISPNFSQFGTHRVGTNTTANPTTFTVRNIGQDVSGPLSVTVEGTDATNFQLVATDCQNLTLQPRNANSCTVRIRFVPLATGSLTALLSVTSAPGGVVRSTLNGVGN